MPSGTAPGLRNRHTGVLYSVGDEGSVWSASSDETNSIWLRFVMDAVQASYAYRRSYGFQLRCLSE
ncbi:hypothetical protein [uncultured Rikenella sp.]|uniref:hypothetical protein n=1 Tax=uncultured Rikenella sp. TaxID=368003 RepID=UPI0026095F48|nr:hypothetical protein [uncultured Rikenella sp.]